MQTRETKGLRIVVVGCGRTVGVFDARPLAFGVVIEVGDEARPHQFRIALRTPQNHVNFFQQIGFVIRRSINTFIRTGGRNDSVECVIGGAGGEFLDFHGWGLGPVTSQRQWAVLRHVSKREWY